VISAVGHEVDFTIADFVADVRAATPSNAAEIVVDRADHFCARIDRAERRLRDVMQLGMVRREQRVDRARARMERWPAELVLRDRDCRQMAVQMHRAVTALLARASQRFYQARQRLERRDARRVIAALETRTVAAEGRLRELIGRHRLVATGRAGALAARLDALSPLAVLGRGYAVCWTEDRTRILRSAAAVHPGDHVRVTLAEGELRCTVEERRDQVRS
jgi:exodeoxyribonuclease VII large subunit